ncbi:type II toxin-antitoxin system HigB family toxin [Candidatus Margulisiibacteriota bacterium]
MKLFNLEAIDSFCRKQERARKPLYAWKKIIENSEFKSLIELKNTFRSVDYIRNDTFCFNICGNRFRLIVIIIFKHNKAIIDKIMTHTEYNKWNKKRRR